jgi:hypothetical protein
MKKSGLVAGAVAGAMLAGSTGCALEKGAPDDWTAVKTDVTAINPTDSLKPYETLPKMVAQQTPTAVMIAKLGARASGTMLKVGDMKVAITAAHALAEEVHNCKGTAATADIDGDKGNKVTQVAFTHQSAVEKRPYTTKGYDFNYNSGLDAAILLPRTAESTQHVTAIKPQKEIHVTPGDVLFSINYQPTPEDVVRDSSTVGALGRPAIYAHVVVSETETHIATITGLKSYGAIEDTSLRDAGSGGELLNAQGGYIGMTNAAIELTSQEIQNSFNMTVPDGTYKMAFSRKIDADTVAEMTQSAQARPACAH